MRDRQTDRQTHTHTHTRNRNRLHALVPSLKNTLAHKRNSSLQSGFLLFLTTPVCSCIELLTLIDTYGLHCAATTRQPHTDHHHHHHHHHRTGDVEVSRLDDAQGERVVARDIARVVEDRRHGREETAAA